jgi:hypothetical protein
VIPGKVLFCPSGPAATPMDVPLFRFDYSFLDLAALAKQCISPAEIEAVFYSVSSHYEDYTLTDGFSYTIGYSPRNKFISFTFDRVDDVIRLTQVYLSYELEIKNRYFK